MHSPLMIALNIRRGCLEVKCRYWYKFNAFWYVLMSKILVKGKLLLVRSIDWKADSCVNFRLGWTELRLMRKQSSSSFEWVQIINMSSIYLVSIRG